MDFATLQNEYPVATEIKVKWGEMDAWQHLNNTVYIRYIEDGRMDLFEKISMSSDMKNLVVGPILAAIQCDYLAPVTYPDTLTVFSKAQQTSSKKVAFEHALWSEKSQCVVAKGTALVVYYDFKRLKSCEIPTEVSAKFNALNQP
jgi:acyl-CoA thioester hydrolase